MDIMKDTKTTCQTVTHPKRSRGILGKGTETFTTTATTELCTRPAIDGDHLCKMHRHHADALTVKLEALRIKRAAEAARRAKN